MLALSGFYESGALLRADVKHKGHKDCKRFRRPVCDLETQFDGDVSGPGKQ